MSREPAPPDEQRARRLWIAAFWGYLVVIGAISAAAYMRLIPGRLLTIPYVDAGMHFFLLGGASYLSHRALGGRTLAVNSLEMPLGPLVVGLVAATDECVQALVPWRTFSGLDMAANLTGVAFFGALAARAVRRREARQRGRYPA